MLFRPGDGGDGWAIDFLTTGVTTAAVPEPSSIVISMMGMVALAGFARKLRRTARCIRTDRLTFLKITMRSRSGIPGFSTVCNFGDIVNTMQPG